MLATEAEVSSYIWGCVEWVWVFETGEFSGFCGLRALIRKGPIFLFGDVICTLCVGGCRVL